MKPGFIDHLVFRVQDLALTGRFYTSLLGSPDYATEDTLMYITGQTRLFFTPAGQQQEVPYAKERHGLNHLAFGVRTLEELKAVEIQLNSAGIQHSGIQIDRYGLVEFIWLDDPDGFRLEFYLRPAEA